MTKTTLQLETLTCPSCAKRIDTALNKQNGVNSVDVKFNTSRVEVEYDEAIIDSNGLSEVIRKIGYKVLEIK